MPLKIELSSGEYLWAEYRQDYGFDSQLPGEGLLVSIENSNVGGLENNDANTDSRHPLLRVIEADMDDGLMGGGDDRYRVAMHRHPIHVLTDSYMDKGGDASPPLSMYNITDR